MRPALLRLLKRPSALSILDTLVAAPIGIDQLQSRYTRLRCQSRCAGGLTAGEKEDSSEGHGNETVWAMPGVETPPSFPIYEIEPSTKSQAFEPTPPNHSHRYNRARSASELCLQPERLAFESDIGHTRDVGTRLVDHSEHKDNFELWEELLRFRQRHWGDQGTLDIWKGLTVRVDGIWLPVSGERADFFWQSFVELALKRVLPVKDVVDYAIKRAKLRGERWPPLYESVVGGLLERGRTETALAWHQKLQSTGLAGAGDLVGVLLPAMHASAADSDTLTSRTVQRHTPDERLEIFRELCSATPAHQIYGPAISMLLQEGHGEEALSLHNFLIERNDGPKSPKEIQPLLDYVKKYGLKKEFKELESFTQDWCNDVKDIGPEIPEENENPTDATESASKGKPLKDDIGARLFATRAFNFDMVLGALKVLGVSAIGPRTLREMALRSNGSQDILEKIKVLRQFDFSIGDTVFARLVQKLASENREILLSDLLQSDQHPDVLEDARMQESLLSSYYITRDSRQYNLTLAVLAELLPDSPRLLDIHFRKHISFGEFDAAAKVVDELALRGRTLSENSVDFMAEQVLTPRRMNHIPTSLPTPGRRLSMKGEVMFIFKILQRVVPAGGYVSTAFWVELLKRLGMANCWDDLRECSLWVVRQYSPKSKPQNEKPWVETQPQMGTARGQDSRMVNLIFPPAMQAAIVAWGFMYVVTHETKSKALYSHPITGHKLIPWTRGLILLRELEQAGLVLQTDAIRQATRVRLKMLYGDYCHSAVPMNRTLRRKNPYRMQRVLEDIRRAWGGSLFDGMEISNPERVVNPPRQPGTRARRRLAGVQLPRRRGR